MTGVGRDERVNACVVWITGMSGAGKSTVAISLVQRLQALGIKPIFLDGDVVRDVIQASDAGYDREGRLRNAYRVSRLAQVLYVQGFVVVVATVSLFREIQAWNREKFSSFIEVYLDATAETRRRRDPKGLYREYELGRQSNIAGVDLPIDIPSAPDLWLENNGPESEIEKIVYRIQKEVLTRVET